MSHELHDLMTRAVEDLPAVRVDEGLWRRARRARRRRRTLSAVAMTAVVAGVLLGGGQVPDLLDRAGVAEPAAAPGEPGIPAQVFAVPEHMDALTAAEEWSYERAPTLKIGTTGVVFTTRRGAPVAVSAVDGGYHLLDLPGYDHTSSFRFEDGVLALSPDGRRLAYTWNRPESPMRDGADYVPSGVRIVDLVSGEVTDHQARKGFGVFSHGFSWSPNGRYLVYNSQIANTSQSGTRGTRSFFVERLDTVTGERSRAWGLRVDGQIPAVSDPGTVMVGDGLNLWTWRPQTGPGHVDLSGSASWRGSVVSIGSVPGSDRVLVSAGLEHARLFVGRPTAPESFRWIGGTEGPTRVLGAVDGDTQALLHEPVDGMAVWTHDLRGAARRSARLVEVDRSGGTGYSFATELLRAPPRDFPEPAWPMSETQKWCLAGGAGTAAVGIVVWLLRRRSAGR